MPEGAVVTGVGRHLQLGVDDVHWVVVVLTWRRPPAAQGHGPRRTSRGTRRPSAALCRAAEVVVRQPSRCGDASDAVSDARHARALLVVGRAVLVLHVPQPRRGVRGGDCSDIGVALLVNESVVVAVFVVAGRAVRVRVVACTTLRVGVTAHGGECLGF